MKFGSWGYSALIALAGALLIELLTQNGIGHLHAARTGIGETGLFSKLNDWLYIPASLITIGVICLFMEKRLSVRFKLISVLSVALLVMWMGHLL
jgi:hypothetical protein